MYIHEKIALRKRAIIETANDLLKSGCQAGVVLICLIIVLVPISSPEVRIERCKKLPYFAAYRVFDFPKPFRVSFPRVMFSAPNIVGRVVVIKLLFKYGSALFLKCILELNCNIVQRNS